MTEPRKTMPSGSTLLSHDANNRPTRAYVPAAATDIRATFAAARAALQPKTKRGPKLAAVRA